MAKKKTSPAKSAEKATLVLIPYVRAVGTPESIQMALRGWQKFCRQPVRLVVLGEIPSCSADFPDVTFLAYAPSCGNPHVNTCRALMDYLPQCDDETFVLSADDIVPVRPFDIGLLAATPRSNRQLPLDANSDNYFIADMARTLGAVPNAVNYSVHVPHRYDRAAFLKLCNDWHLDKEAYDYESLYYNTVRHEDAGVLAENNELLITIMQYDRLELVRRRIGSVTFVNFGGSCCDGRYYELVDTYIS